MNASPVSPRGARGPRKARASSAPDPATANQRRPGVDSGSSSSQSGASSGDTPIAPDDRSGACATSVAPEAAEPTGVSRRP